MLMTNFLRNRRSVREFKNKNVSVDTIDDIKSYIEVLKKETHDIEFKLYENGDFIYDRLKGISGYSGIMVESPHYIALEQKSNDRYVKIYGPYYMEKLITELNRLGIKTCWVSVGRIEKQFKDTVFGEHTGDIDYILAIGYEKRKNPFKEEVFSEKIGVEEIVYSGGIEKKIDNEELERRGFDDLFYYVGFAPSNANLQPWRFLLGKDKITLFIKHDEDEKPNLADAGIIMYYFSELAKSMGIESEWQLIEGSHIGKDGIYECIGEIKI